MAELPAEGKLHEVNNAEADDVIQAAEHGLLHNEAIGRVIRNMYTRIQELERQAEELEAKRGQSRRIFHAHFRGARSVRTNWRERKKLGDRL